MSSSRSFLDPKLQYTRLSLRHHSRMGVPGDTKCVGRLPPYAAPSRYVQCVCVVLRSRWYRAAGSAYSAGDGKIMGRSLRWRAPSGVLSCAGREGQSAGFAFDGTHSTQRSMSGAAMARWKRLLSLAMALEEE